MGKIANAKELEAQRIRWIELIRLIGPRIKELADLYFELVSIADPITSEIGITKRVTVSLKIAKVIVEISPGATDDEIYAVIDKILIEDGLLKFVAEIVSKLLSGMQEAEVRKIADARVKTLVSAPEDLPAGKLSLDKWWTVIQLILEIIRMFQGAGESAT